MKTSRRTGAGHEALPFVSAFVAVLPFPCLAALLTMDAPARTATEITSPPGELRGNVKSLIRHNSRCGFHDHAKCTARFASRDDAKHAGYKPFRKRGG